MKPIKELLAATVAKTNSQRGFNYVQVSSVDDKGFPHNRTLVFRGWKRVFEDGDEDGTNDAMSFITNLHSEKVAHFDANPVTEVVWWFPQTSEQYRIFASVHMVDAGETNGAYAQEREALWKSIRGNMRETFFWPPQNQVIQPNGAPPSADVPKDGCDENGNILPPPESFLILLAWPKKWKYLELNSSYAQIDELDPNTRQWQRNRVTP